MNLDSKLIIRFRNKVNKTLMIGGTKQYSNLNFAFDCLVVGIEPYMLNF